MSTWPVWRLDTWLQASLALEVPAAGARALLHDLLLMDSTTESDSSTLEPSMGSKGIPFQELKLTVDEQQNCRDRSFQLLDRTLRSYDERDGQEDNGRPSDPLHHSNLDNTRWKQLKTQESASLYVERSNSMHRDDNILGGDWINPMVFLMAGTIQGELDEVMLGVETPIVANSAARIIGCFVLRRIVCDARCTWLMPTSDSENVAYTRDKLRYLNPANCTRAVVAESPVTAMATRSSGASTTATSWPLPNSVRSRIPTQIPRSQR
ncbi:hypothetical protein PC128_g19566 [Phytophthora cactorum]|nr:hypothetical protein PC128_g19566 [Phytophthora cactorum]